jgi:ParB family chromosome partitioning protein
VFDEAALDQLARSIERIGLVQPIVVRPLSDGRYRLIAGERRWRAAQQAGLAELPAIVRNDLDPEQAAVLGLIENLQRESLGVMDTAHALARLGDAHGLTHEAIASRIGKSRAYVSNFLRLRQLDPAVQAMLDDGRINIGHAKILAGVATGLQQRLAQRVASEKASVRRLERWLQKLGKATPTPPAGAHGLAELERQLSENLGNTVHIRYNADRRQGELRVAFHDLDEFDGLLERLGLAREDP